MTQGDLGSFHLSSTSVPVSPYLEVVTQAISFLIEVVDQNGLLSNIAVKPFVLRLEVQTLLLLSNQSGFSDTWGSIDPDTPLHLKPLRVGSSPDDRFPNPV